jgi:hypothetical protein
MLERQNRQSMRLLKSTVSDDLQFVEWVDSIIHAVIHRTQPAQIYVVKIDNWFGRRWLRFSGKASGALGVREAELTMPPFIPSRVVSEHRFLLRGSNVKSLRRLHIHQKSGHNLTRRIERAVRFPRHYFGTAMVRERMGAVV